MLDAKLIELLMQRLNHLEVLIFSSIIGLFVTTTSTIIIGLLAINNQDIHKKMKPLVGNHIFHVVAVIYLLLSCYYHFMVMHFCSTSGTLFPLLAANSTNFDLTSYWSFYKVTFSPSGWPVEPSLYAIFSLVPVFPLGLSLFTLYFMKSILRARFAIDVGVPSFTAWSALMILPAAFNLSGPLMRLIRHIQ
jgi:hypothetical protein